MNMGEFDRVRTLYQKYLQWAPANCGAWCKYAEVEHGLGELERARAIYELAIEQPVLDMPEVLWKVPSSFWPDTHPVSSAMCNLMQLHTARMKPISGQLRCPSALIGKGACSSCQCISFPSCGLLLRVIIPQSA